MHVHEQEEEGGGVKKSPCIKRGRAEADPAPNPHMIWKVFPYMLTQVSNSLKSQTKVYLYVLTQVRV